MAYDKCLFDSIKGMKRNIKIELNKTLSYSNVLKQNMEMKILWRCQSK